MDLQLAESNASYKITSEQSGLVNTEASPYYTAPVARSVAGGLTFSVDGNAPVRPLSLAVKRVLDVVLSALALVALLPLLVLVAIAIKVTSPGPVLFVQQRPGLHGALFPMLKFRTMYNHMGDRSGLQQTVKNDQRITRIGAFLRRTSIDELPQLINILLGHMSIIGPRPHPVRMLAGGMDYQQLVPYYAKRWEMRPGLSGWAQVNGLRGPTDRAEVAVARINHDLAYIQNFSIQLDIKIIVATLWREFVGGSGF
ncbi:sugar transferase [Devosia sp. FKR38]|uniref:sugar transferase n=1 Tax=Devosia sp. FKR38 TaxID=2562312 RepID=UPI0020BE84F1|nr:sugar transferase [Devosia sp. FKR38]